MRLSSWLSPQDEQRENGENSSETHLVDGQAENHKKVVDGDSLLGDNNHQGLYPSRY